MSIATTDLVGLKVHIVGAGVAGLSAAIALAQEGATVNVFERAEVLEDVGAGLQLSPNALRALDALEVEPRATWFSDITLYDGLNDARLARLPLRRANMPYAAAHRADLIDALYQRTVALSIPVTLGVESGDNPDADLVIGADGVRSALRASLTGSAPRFTGKMAWRALIAAKDIDPDWIERGLQTFLGPKAHLVTYPLRENSILNVVGIVDAEDGIEENWRQKGDVTLMRAGFAGWSKRVWSLMDPIDDLMMWGLFDHKPLPRWQDGRRVLVGDAAHPVVPFFAQGAAMALEDAVVLANCLLRAPVDEAVQRFEFIRKPRTSSILRASWGNARLFHFESPVMRFGRIATMPILSRVAPSIFTKRYDWVYGYDPRMAH
ncbi:MAG: FAD-dependent monooxygenase [Pseudomonadota bacterium]